MQQEREEISDQQACRSACPVCGGELIEIREATVFHMPQNLRDLLRRRAGMIFRLSQKLNTKIKAGTLPEMPLDDNPYADWSCHLFTADRIQYILLTNTKSLYSCVMYGKGISSESVFIERALGCIREFMEADGQAFAYQKFILPASGTVSFAKAFRRSVTGSMNDLVKFAKLHMIEDGLSPFDAGLQLNDMPMSALERAFPREAFKHLV